jgi:hypothetical protein
MIETVTKNRNADLLVLCQLIIINLAVLECLGVPNQNCIHKEVEEQYGFRKGLSTEDAAFKLTDSVLKSIDQKKHAGGIF